MTFEEMTGAVLYRQHGEWMIYVVRQMFNTALRVAHVDDMVGWSNQW